MPGSLEERLQMALQFWEQGHRFEAAGQVMRAGHCYTRGLGSFLSYVKLAPDLQLAPVYYAFGALGRDTAQLLAAWNHHQALQNARMALAASHLADPTRGEVGLISHAVRNGRDQPVQQLAPTPGRPVLTAELRIAGAAAARDLLASLLGAGATRRSARGLWPIGSGPRLSRGLVGYRKEQKRYMQAMLPSCAGLSEGLEQKALWAEADAIHRELRRVAPEFDPGPHPERPGRSETRRSVPGARRRRGRGPE